MGAFCRIDDALLGHELWGVFHQGSAPCRIPIHALVFAPASISLPETAEVKMKKNLSTQTVTGFMVLSIVTFISPFAHGAELCGLLSEVGKETNDSPRFRILKEF